MICEIPPIIVQPAAVFSTLKLSLKVNPVATSLVTTDLPALPKSFFCRPAEVVAPELIGCRLVKRQTGESLFWGVIVEREAYSQGDPDCLGYRLRSPQNETLFNDSGHFTRLRR